MVLHNDEMQSCFQSVAVKCEEAASVVEAECLSLDGLFSRLSEVCGAADHLRRLIKQHTSATAVLCESSDAVVGNSDEGNLPPLLLAKDSLREATEERDAQLAAQQGALKTELGVAHLDGELAEAPMALAPVRCWEPARLQLHGGADCAAPHWDLQPGAAEGSSCAASSGGEESGSLGFGFSPPGGAADGAGEETGGAAGPASLAGRNTDRQRGRRGRRGRSRGRSRARHANAWARESPCATTDPQAAQGDEGFPDGEQQHRGAGGRGQASGCSERGKSPSARDLVNSQREQGAEEASPKRPRVRAASDSAYGPQKGRTQAGSSPRESAWGARQRRPAETEERAARGGFSGSRQGRKGAGSVRRGAGKHPAGSGSDAASKTATSSGGDSSGSSSRPEADKRYDADKVVPEDDEGESPTAIGGRQLRCVPRRDYSKFADEESLTTATDGCGTDRDPTPPPGTESRPLLPPPKKRPRLGGPGKTPPPKGSFGAGGGYAAGMDFGLAAGRASAPDGGEDTGSLQAGPGRTAQAEGWEPPEGCEGARARVREALEKKLRRATTIGRRLRALGVKISNGKMGRPSRSDLAKALERSIEDTRLGQHLGKTLLERLRQEELHKLLLAEQQLLSGTAAVAGSAPPRKAGSGAARTPPQA